MGKRAALARGKSEGGTPALAWTSASVVVIVVAWLFFQRPADTLASEISAAAPETEDAGDEKLDLVRSNLFSQSGLSRFDRSSNAAGQGEHRPASKRNFSDASYWDERYAKAQKDSYDWYGTWHSESALRLKPHISSLMPTKPSAILNIGCGNSRFPEELSDDGYSDIMSIDISQVAVDKMSARLASRTGLKFLQMDAMSMSFPDGSFHVVFEKGTLDALYTGGAELVRKTIAEVFRVLRPGGLFVSMSFGAPSSRKELNATDGSADGEQSGWARFRTIALERGATEGSETFFVYAMSKPVSQTAA